MEIHDAGATEKFEFFPVKCRVQLALELNQIELENEKAVSTVQIILKTKANTLPRCLSI